MHGTLSPTGGRVAVVAAVVLAALVLAATAGLLVLAVANDAWLAQVVDIQRDLHRRLAAALAEVRETGPAAAWPLVALSFAYGVFHAAGPGHGKLVIATYLTTQESRLATALALTFAAAMAQAVTAVVAVHAAVTVLGLTLRQARGGVAELELMSFLLVALLGAGLALRAAGRLLRPATACASCGGHHAPVPPRAGLAGHLAVIAAIGLRPCAGAVVVLLLAHAGGIRAIGIGAAFAMALGTAITTGGLAALAVTARRSAQRLAARLPAGDGRLARLGALAALLGGLVLLAAGLLLAHAAWTVPAHPLR